MINPHAVFVKHAPDLPALPKLAAYLESAAQAWKSQGFRGGSVGAEVSIIVFGVGGTIGASIDVMSINARIDAAS